MVLLESLYNAHRGAMFHRALSVLGDRALAEDAVHESILRIARVLPRFEAVPAGEHRYLCLAIARNAALNLRRDRGETVPLPDSVPADASDIALGLDIAGAIEALDESLHQVVMLRLRYGFDTAETARLMGITQGAVRRRLHRAREILRKSLEEHERVGRHEITD
jgi:RNA polymerase sigma-70 factor (ECF subfamily)